MLAKLLTKSGPFTFNRAGYYYLSRLVPADLIQHYFYPRIVQGLKTKSAHTAKTRALVAAAKNKVTSWPSFMAVTATNIPSVALFFKSGPLSDLVRTLPDFSVTSCTPHLKFL